MTRSAKAQSRRPGRVPLASIRSAKCTTCEIRWVWNSARPRVMDAVCPVCAKPLERASQSMNLPVREARVVKGHVPYSGGVGPMLAIPRSNV